MTADQATQPLFPAAAVARRLGIAPATLRTWDRRYGVGPSGHRAGQHRRYTAADLARLEALQELVQQGVTVADAAEQLRTQPPSRRRPGLAAADRPDHAGRARPTGVGTRPVTPRQLREVALRLDADRVVALLHRAVGDAGVIAAWDAVVRPALGWLGDRWQTSDSCIAAEHVLSESASAVFTSLARQSAPASTRPILLVCAPGDEHVLPLHALAAALTERRVRNCVVGPSTPVTVAAEAIRRLGPSAVVVWSQLTETADPAALTRQPQIRAGHRMVAAGPGWAEVDLPARVERPTSLADAVALLTA